LHELVTADDPAAVLDWRISHSPTQPGPLPWFPAIPEQLREHRDWGGYLTDRARRVRDLDEEVHASAADPAARQRLPWPRR
jgi:hypothetical protein